MSRVFTPRAIASLEPMIRDVIRSFLDPLDDAEEFDAVADLAGPFPIEVISRMLGVPEGQRQQIRHWIDISLRREPGQLEPSDENQQAIMQAGAYFYELVTNKRAHPGDDMLSRLTQVTVDRGDGTVSGLDDAEIAGFATLLGGAGAETVTKLVGNAVVVFSEHRDQWDKVADDREAIPQAVDEILRFLPPSQYQGRFSVEQRDFEGGTIPAGHPVLLITGAATRDPRVRTPGRVRHRTPRECCDRLRPRRAQLSRRRARRAWKVASRSKSWQHAGSVSRSTPRGCDACRCPTSPAMRMSPCVPSIEQLTEEMVRPLPQLTPTNDWFWTSGADGHIRIQGCNDCGKLVHPPVPVCPACRSRSWSPTALSGRGTVVAFTVNYHQWLAEFTPPYAIANVALAEDPTVHLTTNVVGCDPDEVHVGQQVVVRFEQHEDVWLPLFEPTGATTTEDLVGEPRRVAPRPPVRSDRFEHRAVLSGVGRSALGRRLMVDPLSLTVDASLAAIEDAGLHRRRHRRVIDLSGCGRDGHERGWHHGGRRGTSAPTDVDKRGR